MGQLLKFNTENKNPRNSLPKALIMILETRLDNAFFNQTCGACKKKIKTQFVKNRLTILHSIKHVGPTKKESTNCVTDIRH